MKKLSFVVVLLVNLVFFFNGSVQAVNTKVISEKNQYGGKTVEETYEKADKLYGICTKIMTYLDNQQRIREKETYYTDTQQESPGVHRSEAYFEPDGQTPKSLVVFYTDKSPEVKLGITKKEFIYAPDGIDVAEVRTHFIESAKDNHSWPVLNIYDYNPKYTSLRPGKGDLHLMRKYDVWTTRQDTVSLYLTEDRATMYIETTAGPFGRVERETITPAVLSKYNISPAWQSFILSKPAVPKH
jgi:hypothetical protein